MIIFYNVNKVDCYIATETMHIIAHTKGYHHFSKVTIAKGETDMLEIIGC